MRNLFNKKSTESVSGQKSTSIAYALLMLCATLLICAAFQASGSTPFQSPEQKEAIAASKEEAALTYGKENILPGDITDRNGVKLIWSEQDAEGNVVTKYEDPLAYTQALGFYKDLGNGSSIGYLMAGMQPTRNWLYKADSDTTKGCTVQTSLDADLQKYNYNLLSSLCTGEDQTGSIVVMDARNGEVLSWAFYPSFDPEKLVKAYEDAAANPDAGEVSWTQIASDKLGVPTYPLTHGRTPGSVFKIITSMALLEQGGTDLSASVYQYYDDSGYLAFGQNASLPNAGGAVYGALDFTSAFVNSVNVYFAWHAINTIYKSGLDEVAARCGFDRWLDLDFGTMISGYAFDSGDDFQLALTAIGQNNVQMSAVHVAMITAAVAGDGHVYEPHMMKAVYENEELPNLLVGYNEYKQGNQVWAANPADYEDFTEPVTEPAIAGIIRNAMQARGRNLAEDYGYGYIDAGGKTIAVGAKTGTGDISNEYGENVANNLWLTTFAPAEDPRYVVVMNLSDVPYDDPTYGEGANLYPEVQKVYEKVYELLGEDPQSTK